MLEVLNQKITVHKTPASHWVGDGFPVRTMISPQSMSGQLSPFLLLDYAGPAYFEPTDKPRGVDEHPHRGFETVTVVYQGEVEHRDSTGNSGKIGPGDVQWMTAASGVVHEEKHGTEFSRRGGVLEMIQLWVNLPAKDKMSPPGYQTIMSEQIPAVDLEDGMGSVRVIAGNYKEFSGPAKTFTPITMLDIRLKAGSRTRWAMPFGHTTLFVVLTGKLSINASEDADTGSLVVVEPNGEEFQIEAFEESSLLMLSGEPILEPIASYGPFVMNTREELEQAFEDYQSGKMGTLD